MRKVHWESGITRKCTPLVIVHLPLFQMAEINKLASSVDAIAISKIVVEIVNKIELTVVT